eukprot:2523070-Prymnesium_polylepis.1
MWPELLSICGAYGITLREIQLPYPFHNGTSDYYDEVPEPYTPQQQPAPRLRARRRCQCGCYTLCAPGE